MSQTKTSNTPKIEFLRDLFWPAVRQSNSATVKVIGQLWPLILGLFALLGAAELYLEDTLANLLAGDAPMLTAIYRAGLELACDFTLMMAVFGRLIELESAQPRKPLLAYFKRWTGPLTIETLRAAAKTIMWTVALIIPGLIWYLRLSFVPYIVMASRAYDEGQIDVLEHSEKLTRGILTPLGLIAGATFALALGARTLAEGPPGSDSFFPALGAIALTVFMSVYTYVLIFEIYRRREMQLAEGKL